MHLPNLSSSAHSSKLPHSFNKSVFLPKISTIILNGELMAMVLLSTSSSPHTSPTTLWLSTTSKLPNIWTRHSATLNPLSQCSRDSMKSNYFHFVLVLVHLLFCTPASSSLPWLLTWPTAKEASPWKIKTFFNKIKTSSTLSLLMKSQLLVAVKNTQSKTCKVMLLQMISMSMGSPHRKASFFTLNDDILDSGSTYLNSEKIYL